MKKILLTISSILMTILTFGQASESPSIQCADEGFNKKVNKMLNYSVDVISVSELNNHLGEYTLLDTREIDEYLVSRIPGALHLGYKNPKWETLDVLDKNQPVIVYCSIGYRSEKIGEKLKKQGFANVRNLYGSIFEWANQGYSLEDPRGNTTNIVHGYNKKWSKYVKNDAVDVTY